MIDLHTHVLPGVDDVQILDAWVSENRELGRIGPLRPDGRLREIQRAEAGPFLSHVTETDPVEDRSDVGLRRGSGGLWG